MSDVVDLAARPPDRLEPDEVAYLRALLAGRPVDAPTPLAAVADPGWVPTVVAGAVIESAWGNAVRDRLAHRFASVVDRDAAWPTPPNGARAITVDTATNWQRIAGAWQARDAVGVAYKVDQSIPSGVWTAVTWAGVTVARNVSRVGNDLRADHAGIYLLAASVVFAGNAAGTARLIAVESGAAYVHGEGSHPPMGANPVVARVVAVIAMNAGDVVRVRAYQDSGAGLILGGSTGSALVSSFALARLANL